MNRTKALSKNHTKTANVLDVNFSKWSMHDTTNWIVSKLQADTNQADANMDQLHMDQSQNHNSASPGKLAHIVTANPEIVMAAQEHEQLKQALDEADLITPDGTGIVWAANYLGNPVTERVAGYDLLHALCQTSEQQAFSVYLLGAKEETNQKAADKLAALYPKLQIVGRRNGYFTAEEEQDIIKEINQLRPHLLLVALGFPKQELWIHQHKEQLQAKVAIGVGGSLDVLAGTVKRAPQIWQRLRIEWLYRLLQEPSRFRRQLVLPKFVIKVKQYKKLLQKM